MGMTKDKLSPAHLAAMLAGRKRLHESRPFEVRFWEKVDKSGPNGCWLWTGSKDQDGYGFIWYQGRVRRAHRVSLILAGMTPPEYDGGSARGLVVDHACHEPSCVRPEHLRIVPQGDNCCTLSRGSFSGRNKAKTECVRGHPFAGENLARILVPSASRKGGWIATRCCLTCWPHYHNHPRRFWLPEDLPGLKLDRVIPREP